MNEPVESAPAVTDDAMRKMIARIAEHGDKESFGKLFSHMAPRLVAFARKSGASRHDAEELAQETMIAVWRKAKLFDGSRNSAAGWIFAIARNKRIDRFRREKRPEIRPEELYEDTEARRPDDAMQTRQTRQALAEKISSLPPEQIEMLKKAYFEEMSHSEISAQLGLPLGTVKSRVRLALARLRVLMVE